MSDGGGASLEELREGLRQTLEANGSLGQIKARVRAEVFHALDEQGGGRSAPLSPANLLVNELVREYLEFAGYRYTASVLGPESGQPAEPPFDRAYIERRLNLPRTAESARVPLLYSVVALLEAGADGAAAAREDRVPGPGREQREQRGGRQRRKARAAPAPAGDEENERETGVYEERRPIHVTK